MLLTCDEFSNMLSNAMCTFTMRIGTDASHVLEDSGGALHRIFRKDVGSANTLLLHEMRPFCQSCYLAPEREWFLSEKRLLLRITDVGCYYAFEFELLSSVFALLLG